METLSGAKFQPSRDHNCGLRRFFYAKPTYSDQQIHKLSNCDKKFLLQRRFNFNLRFVSNWISSHMYHILISQLSGQDPPTRSMDSHGATSFKMVVAAFATLARTGSPISPVPLVSGPYFIKRGRILICFLVAIIL